MSIEKALTKCKDYENRFINNTCYESFFKFRIEDKFEEHCNTYKKVINNNDKYKSYIINGDMRYFTSHSSLDRFKSFIKIEERKENNVLEWSSNQYRKIYFDVDKIECSKSEIKDFSLWLKSEIERVAIIEINDDDIIILIRENIDNNLIVKSFHIIIKSFSCHYLDVLFFIRYLKKNNKDKHAQYYQLINELDEKPYMVTQQLSMYNTLSFKKDKPRQRLIEIDNRVLNSKEFKETLIDDIENTTTIKFTLLFVSNIFDKYLKRGNIQTELKQEYLIKEQKKLNLVIENNEKKEPKYYNSFEEFYIDIIENDYLDKALFEKDNCRDWIYISESLNKHKFKSFNHWLLYSAENSKEDSYTETSNKNYFENKKVKDRIKTKTTYKHFKNLVKDNLNKFLSFNAIITYKLNDDIINFVYDKVNDKITDNNKIITTETIREDLKNGFKIHYADDKEDGYEKKLWKINKDDFNVIVLCYNNELYLYNIENYYLIDTKKKIIYNYLYEKKYKLDSSLLKFNDNKFKYDTLEDAKHIINNFKTDDNKVLLVNARWGSGKTHYVSNELIESFYNNKKRIIILTQSNALNTQLENDFKKYGLVSHQSDSINWKKNIITSLESIDNIENYNNNYLLILDEYESLFNYYENEVTFKNKKKKFKVFIELLKHSKKIICLDADLSTPRTEYLKRFHNKIITIDTTINKFEDCNINLFMNDNIEFNTKLYEDIRKKRIGIVTDRKQNADNYYQRCKDATKDLKKNIGLITADGLTIFYNNEEIITKNKNEYDDIKHLDNMIRQYDLDILIYTPKINTGISINEARFDKVYCFFTGQSVNARMAIQMIFRIRIIKEKEINIFLQSRARMTSTITEHNLIKHCITPSVKIKNGSLYTGSFKMLSDECDEFLKCENNNNDYYQLILINKTESINSEFNFNKEFLTRLIYKHKFNYKIIYNKIFEITESKKKDIIYETSNEEKEIKKKIRKSDKQVKDEKEKEFYETEIINKNEYDSLLQKQEDNKFEDKKHLTRKEENKIRKYSILFNQLPSYASYELSNEKLYDFEKSKIEEFNNDLKKFKFWRKFISSREKVDLSKLNMLNGVYDDLIKYERNNKKFNKRDIEEKQQYTELFNGNSNKKEYKRQALLKLIMIFNIKLDIVNLITNKEFQTILKKNIEWFKTDFLSFIEVNYKKDVSTFRELDIDNKLHCKFIYTKIQNLLCDSYIIINYENKKHTTAINDTMLIYINDNIQLFNINEYHKTLMIVKNEELQEMRYKPLIITEIEKNLLCATIEGLKKV